MKRIFQLASFIIVLLAIFSPDIIGMGEASGLIFGSTLITTSVSWGGKENLKYFLKPMFIGKTPWETQGVRVLDNIQSGQNLNYFSSVSKILKAYTAGFNTAGASTYTQRAMNVYRLKAESADDANDFYQTVFEQALRKDDWNALDGTMMKGILSELYQNAIKSDVFRIFWLAEPYKETVSSGVITGTADADYRQLTDGGMWYKLMANASTTPSATQIYREEISNTAVAQVDTVTLTGTAGTANVTVGGVAYLATFNTNLNTTHADFVALHAAALLLRGITLTGTTTAIFTSTVPGMEQPAPTVANVVANLAGGNVATTPNTAPIDLAAGEAEDTFLDLITNCNIALKQIPKNNKVLLVDRATFENYQLYLEVQSTERGQLLLENGIEFLTYRGIKVICMDWDQHLDADFPHVSTENPAYNNRVIYTAIDNLVMGMDSMNQYNQTKFWYNADEEQNRFRTKLIMGANYIHNKLVAVAY